MERGHLKDLDLDVRMMIKRIFKKRVGEARAGLIWLRIETGGEVLRVR
jgi:hypothetical protein